MTEKDTYTHGYSAEHCRRMIAHYDNQASNFDKPASWRALARVSASEWRHKLEQANLERWESFKNHTEQDGKVIGELRDDACGITLHIPLED